MASERSTRRHLIQRAQELVIWLVGLGGIIHQGFLKDDPDPWLLGFWGLMSGIPGLSWLWNLRPGNGSSPFSPSSPSSSPSASSPPESLDEEAATP